MRQTVFFIIAVIFLTITGAVDVKGNNKNDEDREWGAVVQGCQISIKSEKTEYSACEPIHLKVFIRNTGDKPLKFSDTYLYRDFQIHVKDRENNITPLTAYGRKVSEMEEEFRRVVINLNPGEEKEYVLIVNKIRDMTIPETYRISVERSIFNPSGEGMLNVRSNEISVIVTD